MKKPLKTLLTFLLCMSPLTLTSCGVDDYEKYAAKYIQIYDMPYFELKFDYFLIYDSPYVKYDFFSDIGKFTYAGIELIFTASYDYRGYHLHRTVLVTLSGKDDVYYNDMLYMLDNELSTMFSNVYNAYYNYTK
jgi:hypothetical protein